MPPNGPDEWRARIGHWENRKLRWYRAHCGYRPHVPLHLHLERLISEAPLVCVLLLLWLAGKVTIGMYEGGSGTFSSLGKTVRCFACRRRGKVLATLLLSLFLALFLLLVVAGDVETNPGPINDELLVKVDNSELAEEDTLDVYREVSGLAGNWSSMCLVLGLLPCDQSAIELAHPGNPHGCLRAVVVKWLQKGYNYQRFGSPTWRMLVEAVADPVGGNNGALAETIAKKHPVMKSKTVSSEISYEQYQVQSQPSAEYLKPVEETAVKTLRSMEAITTIEIQPISDDEEWDLPAEFADMLATVTELLDKSANVKRLKEFLKFLSHPRTQKRYIDVKVYEHCNSPREIIEVLYPQYINFMHTHLLRQIVRKFGNEESKTLVQQYEDNFPRKKPLKRMRDPISDEETDACSGTKKIKVKYDGDVDTTTIADVEKVQQTLSRNTRIDESMIVYANQTEGCVIFTFLVPEIVINAFCDLDEDNQKDLANHGILKIVVNSLVIDLKFLQTETKTDTSTYTVSGMKRIPLMHDSPKATYCNSEFQHFFSEVCTSLAMSVEASKLKGFLQSFRHTLYPEAQYIDAHFLKDAESVPQLLKALQPQIINFLNWGILWKTADAFEIEMTSVFQWYQRMFPSHTKLSTVPDPLSEEEILESKAFQKLRLTCNGGSEAEWTLGDVQEVREAVEKATGIDQDFIIFAYWEGGFTTHQFTFLIPKSISGIFEELCEEDLTILAGKRIRRLEVGHDTVEDNIQEWYQECPQAAREDIRMRTKSFGLEHFIPEGEMEQMCKEEFNLLNDLITNTPAGRLQETCSNDFLKKFAEKMGSWKDLTPYFGMNQWDLEDLAEMYPVDEKEQKYVALLNWKSIDVNSATYEKLVECLLTHGHVDDAKKLLLQFQGPEVQTAQDILQQRFLKDSFSKRKILLGAPKVQKFNRSFGILHNSSLLSGLDYTSCYEMVDQFPSEIQELSMKSMLNKITQRESRVFVFKGPPGCGKTEVISTVCSYWAKHYALRRFSLVLYVNIWDVHRGFSLQELIDRQFKCSTVFTEKICQWIKEEKGSEVLFALDGFCYECLYQTPLNVGDIIFDILSGHRNYSKSTVVIATTCSDFVSPLPTNIIQFEILGLSDQQIGKQIIQYFDTKNAINFLSYLAENAEIKGLVSSPSYLIGAVYIFAHVCYNSLPMTWTQLYTSLVVLVNEWHKGKLNEDFGIGLLQSQFKSSLLENCRKSIEGSCDLLATIGKSLIHTAEEFDHLMLDGNANPPYLHYFSFSLEIFLDPDCEVVNEAIMTKDHFAYFWHFLAGLGVRSNSKMLLQRYYGRNTSRIINCVSESGYVTAEQQEDLASLTAEVSQRVVTTRDVHSMLHCLRYMKEPHTVVLEKCFLGRQAARELSRFLAADSWSSIHTYTVIRHYSGISHLCLSGISAEVATTIAVALKTNHSLQTLSLRDSGLTDTVAIALARVLHLNNSLEELNLEGNRIENSGSSALADTLRVNQSLKTLNLHHNQLTATSAVALASALQQNKSLKDMNLGRNTIEDSGAIALADTLIVNQSLKTLNMRHNRLTDTGAIALARALQLNRSLEELNLRGNMISAKGVCALVRVFQVNQSLQKLKLTGLSENEITDELLCALVRELQVDQSHQKLDLSNKKIKDKGACALSAALQVNQSLQELNLNGNQISDEGACELASVLQVNQNLQELNLSFNQISDNGARKVAAALQVNQSLQELILKGNPIKDSGGSALGDSLSTNQSLKVLNLRDCGLTATGAIALARKLKHNKSLEELNLEWDEYQWTGIGDEGATALADLRVIKNFEALNLGYNSLTDIGAIALARVLQDNKSLEELNLEWNRIEDSGAVALADALRVNQSLKTLNLEWNRIEDSGAAALAHALKVNQSLKTLKLNQQGWMSESTMKLLSASKRIEL